MKNRKSLGSVLVNSPYFVWAAIFIIVPLLMVAYYAFTDKSGAFTFHNFAEMASYWKVFAISLLYSVIATAVILLIAYPFAYFLCKFKPGSQKIQIMLVMLPMWMSLLIRTYSISMLLEDNGVINSLITSMGLPALKLINTPAAVIFGMVYNYLPYMILPIYTVMSKIDNSLLEVSADLGCKPIRTVTKVVMPLSFPGVVSGIIMVLVPSISTFYISQRLGGTIKLVGDVIETQIKTNNNLNLGAAMSLVLMIFILISLAIMNKYSDDSEGGMIV